MSILSVVCLDIVTGGWDFPGWETDFYPEDLPGDWRLSYFANEFPVVMVAARHWMRADEAQLNAWSEDVPDEFRFYLEDPGPTLGCRNLDLARRVLGAKLAGLVQDTGVAGSLATTAISRFLILAESGARPCAGCLPAWQIPRDHVRDLRAGRSWLEGLASQTPGGRGLLLLAGADVRIEDLRRWRHLVWLLGLA